MCRDVRGRDSNIPARTAEATCEVMGLLVTRN